MELEFYASREEMRKTIEEQVEYWETSSKERTLDILEWERKMKNKLITILEEDNLLDIARMTRSLLDRDLKSLKKLSREVGLDQQQLYKYKVGEKEKTLKRVLRTLQECERKVVFE